MEEDFMKEEVVYSEDPDFNNNNINRLENINIIESDIYPHDENDEIDNPPTGSTQYTAGGKKRGRPPKSDEHHENSSPMHSKNSKDNMLCKIKSAFCRHMINLLNTTAKVNKYKKIKFYNIDRKAPCKITRRHKKRPLKKNIEEFLIKMGKSNKYRKNDGSNADTVEKIKKNPNYMKIFKPLLRLSLKDYYFHVFLKNSNVISPKSDKVFQEIQKDKKSFNDFLEKQEDDKHAKLLKKTAEDFVRYFSG